MSIAPDALASCAGKVAFESWDRATATLKRRRLRDRFKDEPQQVYRCRCCRHWHIGTAIRERPIVKRQRDPLDDFHEWPWRAKAMQPVSALSNGEAAGNGFIPAVKLSKETILAPEPAPVSPMAVTWTPIALGTWRCEVAIIYVTPAMAKAFLENRQKNRRIKVRGVDFLSRQMKEAWAFTGQPLVFSTEGRLQDGQHRCTGCVTSGKAFITLAVRGIAPDAFDRMDIGAKRTAADVLSINGFSNTPTVAAVVSALMRYRDHGNWWDQKQLVSPHDVAAAAPDFPGVEKAAVVGRCVTAVLSQSSRLWGAARWVTGSIDEEASSAFFGRLINGVGLKATDPELHLRNRMLQLKGSKVRLNERSFAGLFARAWNARRQARALTRLIGINEDEKVPPLA